MDLKGFKRLVKKGKLTLSRSAYQDLLSKMKECNRAISTLTEQSRQLMPTRQSRSRIDRFQVIRDCAKEVYKAFCASFSCSCVSHSINWQLDVPHDSTNAPFRVITATECLDSTNEESKSSKGYSEIELRTTEGNTMEKKRELVSLPVVEKKAKKTLRFADHPVYPNSSVLRFDIAQSSSSSTTTITQSSTSTLVSTKDLSNFARDKLSDIQIENLCQQLAQSSLGEQTTYMGYLNGESQRRCEVFALQSWQIPEGKPSSLSLASLLAQARTASYTPLSLHDRLQLSKSVATGVLQLYNSPLLPSTWTKHDITFVQRSDKPYRKSYISKSIGVSNNSSGKRKVLPYIPNPTLFSLGILLIEICLARTLDDLRTLDDCDFDIEMTNPTMATDYATAIRLLNNDRILEESGEPYADAVRRCISCNFGPTKTDLENESFRQAVYSGVVVPLEEQVKAVLGISAR